MSRIEIPVLQERETLTRFYAELEGITPMLMHKPNLAVASDGPKRTNEKKIPTPTEEAEAGAYRLDDRTLMVPAIWVQRNMIEAGKQFKNPSNTRQTMVRTVAASLIPPPVLGFPIFGPDGEPLMEYEIDTRRAVVQRAAIMRSRPMIPVGWSCTVEMGFDTDPFQSGEVTDQLVTDLGMQWLLPLMRLGGSKLGLGDYRPEKSGPFGRYQVKRFAVERDEDVRIERDVEPLSSEEVSEVPPVEDFPPKDLEEEPAV